MDVNQIHENRPNSAEKINKEQQRKLLIIKALNTLTLTFVNLDFTLKETVCHQRG